MQKIKKRRKIILLGILVYVSLLLTKSNISYGITIDENKYPGYKEAIDKMEQNYPNWSFELFYTGLDWQTVIDNEYTGHGTLTPTSLVYDTYSGEWICPICGSNKKYDLSGRWYCASQKAIKYMMDPRNALTDNYVFQFQNLASSVGDREAVKKMTEGTFLNNELYLNAIMTAATENQVSPFHIVSRIIQEQGSAGNKPYVTGYIYLDKMVYNLFNIGASGGIGDYETGARRAYEEGWFSVEQSIIGGAKFIKEKYINRGQVSLYFQKYNVVEKGNLYQHQYMQNIGAARSEGNSLYNGYKANKIESSHFNFIIPVYENMPKEVSEIPSNTVQDYVGDIANEITTLSLEKNEKGEHYIKGEIVVTEWIDGTTWSVPRKTPKMTLKTKEGQVIQDFWVNQLDNSNTYYFDLYVEFLDPNKEYKIEVESGSKENVSPHRIQQAFYHQNKELGKFRRSQFSILNHCLVFSPIEYYGDIATQITNLAMMKNEVGKTYLAGNILITEWIGSTWTIPDILPSIVLKSTDGSSVYEFWVNPIQNNEYYFDGYIEGIDITKEYVFEVRCNNTYNISKNRIVNAYYGSNLSLGNYSESRVYFRENKLIFEIQTYQGDIATQIKELCLAQNEEGRSYIKGEIIVTEWLNGVTWSIPKKKPIITLKATDGSSVYEFWVNPIQSNEYYFDGYIEGIDTTKEYVLEVKSGSIANVSNNKQQNAYSAEKIILGTYQGEQVIYNEARLNFGKSFYQGDIATQIKELCLAQNEEGRSYIKGEIIVTEWLNGVTWSIPKKKPIITLKATDGSSSYEFWVNPIQSNEYYFDGYIEGIDTTKEYVLEVKSGSSDNISRNKQQNAYYGKKLELGQYYDSNVCFENDRFIFKTNTYRGDVANEITMLTIEQQKDKTKLKGQIVITEWLNGVTWSIPNKTPILLLIDQDGERIQNLRLINQVSNSYQFEIDITELDHKKSYQLQIKSGNSNNISPYAKAIGNFAMQGKIGNYQDKEVMIQNQFIILQQNGQTKANHLLQQETKIEREIDKTKEEIDNKETEEQIDEVNKIETDDEQNRKTEKE